MKNESNAAEPAGGEAVNPHQDYLARYWDMGYNGEQLGAGTDSALRAWSEGRRARLATPPQAPAATATNPQMLKAYELGFLRAAEWTNRDDLRADLDSGAYAKDRARDLGPMLDSAALAASAPGATRN